MERAEADLAERLRAGDPRALAAVHERLGPELYRFLHRLCGSRPLAEDLYQETWVRLARHARRLLDGTDLRAWLYTVARNQYRSHRRWRLLDGERLLRAWMGRAEVAAPDPHAETSAHRTEAVMRAAIAALPVAQREVVLLVSQGFEPQEVAAMLGLRSDAVRQRLARARAALAARLAEPRAENEGVSAVDAEGETP